MLPEEEKESMEKLLDQITAVVSEAFEKAGYEKEYQTGDDALPGMTSCYISSAYNELFL